MIYGYARVSTRGQAAHGNSLQQQTALLRDHGACEIVAEQHTGSTMKRPQLSQLLDKLKTGDTLLVAKLDRLARTTEEGISIIRGLIDRGIIVNILNVGVLDSSPIGKFFLTTMLAVAELERSLIMERMREGKAVARTKDGFREGRPPLPENRKKLAAQLVEEQGKTIREAAELTQMSPATVSRALRAARLRKEEK